MSQGQGLNVSKTDFTLHITEYVINCMPLYVSAKGYFSKYLLNYKQ